MPHPSDARATPVPPAGRAATGRPADGTSAGLALRAPRFAAAWAALVCAVAALALGYPAFAGRFLVNQDSDQYIAGYAFREFAASWERAGHGVPLWNPYLFGGMPYVAGMHGDIFYPTALLRLVLPTDVAMTWGFIIHLALAGLFTVLFLRAAGLGAAAALVGGLAYMLGGNVAGLVSPGHDGKLYVATLLPLALLLVHRGVRDGRRWAWGALALTVTLAVLSPHPQLLQYMLLITGAYALFLAMSRREPVTARTASTAGASGAAAPAPPRRVAVRRLLLAAAAVGVGLLGGAIQYLPLFEYTPWSPRAGGAGWDHAISYSMPPEELINVYLPHFSGILRNYWGRNAIHLHSEYLGAAVLVLAGLAYGRAGASAARRRFLWFWTGALVVSTLWALGGHTPFYHLVYALVPGTTYFRAPSTMLYVVAFCAAVLASLGTDRALTAGVRPRYALGWVAAALLVAVLATAGGLTNLAEGLAPEYALDRVAANAGVLTAGAWRSFLAVAATAGVLLALARGRLSARAAGAALALVVALDLWSVARLYWRFSPPARELYASDAVVDYLKRIPQPGRVLPIAIQPLTQGVRDPYLGGGDGKATGFMVHGVRSLVGYHGNELGRYDVLTGWGTSDYVQRIGNPNFGRLTNLRYLYTNAATPPMAGMRQVAGPVKNVAGNTVYLYEFPDSNPAAWVAPLIVKAGDESVLNTVLDPRFDVRRAALFDSAAAIPAPPVPTSLPAPSDVGVRVQRWEPGRIALTLDRPAPAGSALLVSENFYPGWQATADGKPAPVARADFVLMGVALPAGAREVELRFGSAPYETGKALTLLALALALAGIGVGVWLDRRRGAGRDADVRSAA